MLYTALLFSFSVSSNGERVYPKPGGSGYEILACVEGRPNDLVGPKGVVYQCLCVHDDHKPAVVAYVKGLIKNETKENDIPAPEFKYNLCEKNQVCRPNEENVQDMCTLCGVDGPNIWSGINLSSEQCKCRSEKNPDRMCEAGQTCHVNTSDSQMCRDRECIDCELDEDCCKRYSEKCHWSGVLGECRPTEKIIKKTKQQVELGPWLAL